MVKKQLRSCKQDHVGGNAGWFLRVEDSPLVDIQQGNRDFSPISERNWIHPTIWMRLEEDPTLKMWQQPWQMSWFLPHEITSKDTSYAMLDPDQRQLWHNEYVLFQTAGLVVICYTEIENKYTLFSFSKVASSTWHSIYVLFLYWLSASPH